ncbi:MAG: epoxide hydrolase [Hyphomicrobiales bacterium]|nr:MAG: epoxide hydrolase [Hyphomicrobiales bacterium]
MAIPDDDLADLAARLRSARWPVEVDPGSWQRGVPQDYLRKVVERWMALDWRAVEADLNRYDQVRFTHEGQLLHAFHIRSPRSDAVPLVLIHGWPSSAIEYLKLIEPLTNPAEGPAFHLVIPTQPGFGLSPAVTVPGWTSAKTAAAIAGLMQDLGYQRYGIHGSDMGADVAGQLDQIAAGKAIGVHLATDTNTIVAVASFMSADPGSNPNLSAEQRQRVAAKFATLPDSMGYIAIQSTRPKTIGYALNDSPIGQLAWIIEKFEAWTAPDKTRPEDAVDLDQLLTNVSLYWFGKGGAASANAIWESMKAMGWAPPTGTPQGVAAFAADDLARPLLDPEHKVTHWSEFAAGGHFPAMEEPALLAGDIRKFFGGLTS